MDQKTLIITEKHSRLLRWSHWLNVPVLSLMIWSGVLIYWAHEAYGDIPEVLVNNLNLKQRLAEGMGWHFFLMWIWVINGIVYLSYLIFSGEWRGLIPNRKTPLEAIQVTLHELHLRKEKPIQHGKFNAAQRMAYTGAILMGVGSLITGLAIYKPVQLGFLTWILGGYEAARFEHFMLMIGFMFFIVIHVIQVIRSGWNNFRAMVAGYEIDKD